MPGPPPVKLTFTLKEFYIDHQRMKAAKDRSVNRGITKGLRFIRTRARQSIRRRKGPSKQGQPPHAHTMGPSLKTILWDFDPASQSGIVGPVKLNGTPLSAKAQVTVPNAIEVGGLVTFKAGSWIHVQGRDVRGRFTKKKLTRLKDKKRVRIKPRPFMLPALEFEVAAGNVVSAFRDTFTD